MRQLRNLPMALGHLLALLIALGAMAAMPNPSRAAVAACKAPLAGEHVEDRSETTAKRHALESWTKATRLHHGEQFTRWGIAWNRRLDCKRTDKGVFRCQAIGHPCTIEQVPPANLVPLRRGT
jgi:hypothetical protein